MKGSPVRKSIWAAALAGCAAAALALAACGSDTAPTDLPTRTTPVPAYSFDPGSGTTAGARSGTDGLEFVPWVDIEVSALGFCDAGGDGLLNSHTVGIFDTDTEELVTPTVVVDSESVPDGFYRYESITPVVLKAGRSYTVAGHSESPFDPADKGSGDDWEPELRFVRHTEGPSIFQFPSWPKPSVWMVPNFKFMPVPASSPTP